MPIHVQEWIKGRTHIMLTMPLWTRSEMEVLWKVLYSDKVGLMWPRNFTWNHSANTPTPRVPQGISWCVELCMIDTANTWLSCPSRTHFIILIFLTRC